MNRDDLAPSKAKHVTNRISYYKSKALCFKIEYELKLDSLLEEYGTEMLNLGLNHKSSKK